VEGTYALLRRAILEKRQVHGTYGGHERHMCPHVLGTSEGRARVLVFQFGGSSRRGLQPGGDWRCLLLDGLTRVSIHEGPWHARAHSEPQHCVEEVEVEA
jgi:hypothetical protein